MTDQEIAIDAIERAFGVRLEPHQILAMAVAVKKSSSTSYFSLLHDSDAQPLVEVVRIAYETTKGRRRSWAERGGYACGKECPPGWHSRHRHDATFRRLCCRARDHVGVCSPGVTKYPLPPVVPTPPRRSVADWKK